MKINEKAKIALFNIQAMAKMYGKTDEDFGRFMRGFYQGIMTAMYTLGFKVADFLPKLCPDKTRDIYAAFCATYATFLNTERAPRIDKDSEDHAMMYGPEAQEMMVEAERHLKEIKKSKKGRTH